MPSVDVFDKKFLHKVRQEAMAHGEAYVEGLKWMKEPDGIEKIENDKNYAVEHPYWRGTPEERELALRIMDAQMELLRVLFPRKAEGAI